MAGERRRRESKSTAEIGGEVPDSEEEAGGGADWYTVV
jgi:hypothetical protein